LAKNTIKVLAIALSALLVFAGCSGKVEEPVDNKPGTDTSAEDTIKVGILHSLSGTMAISEVSLKDAELMAIEEINQAGGLLGKKIEPVIEDGASDWPTFAEKAKKLLQNDKVCNRFRMLDFSQP